MTCPVVEGVAEAGRRKEKTWKWTLNLYFVGIRILLPKTLKIMEGNSIVVVYQQSCLLAGVNADFHLGISIAIFSTTRLENNGCSIVVTMIVVGVYADSRLIAILRSHNVMLRFCSREASQPVLWESIR